MASANSSSHALEYWLRSMSRTALSTRRLKSSADRWSSVLWRVQLRAVQGRQDACDELAVHADDLTPGRFGCQRKSEPAPAPRIFAAMASSWQDRGGVVYGLFDPRTGELRYVGKTAGPGAAARRAERSV